MLAMFCLLTVIRGSPVEMAFAFDTADGKGVYFYENSHIDGSMMKTRPFVFL